MNSPRRLRLDTGILIALEGIDGAGKTTQAQAIEHFVSNEFRLHALRDKEPTDGPFGAKLRASATTGRLGRDEELRLFMEDRAEHVRQVIAPELAAGTIVILDRYYYSNAAYQGRSAEEARAIIRDNERFAPRPDLTVILDLEPEVAVARLTARGGQNRFEELEALRHSREIFLSLRGREEVLVVDGNLDRDTVSENIIACVRHFVALRLDVMGAEARAGGASTEQATRSLHRMLTRPPPNTGR